MADYAWSTSWCRADVDWYGFPGQGSYYRTARYGIYWVSSTWGTYRAWGFECGPLGPPVKDYQYLSEFGAAGQWFEGGAVYFKNGSWHVAIGNFGQTAGRLADVDEWPDDVEQPAPPESPRPPIDEGEALAGSVELPPDWVGKRLATDDHGPKA